MIRKGLVVLLVASLSLMAAATFADATPMPRMIAHRGAGDLVMPEASTEAYSNAVAKTVDIVKLDLQYTKDGVVVMGHDGTLKRVMGLDVKIADWTYDDIKGKGRFVQGDRPTDLSIVRLDEALSIVRCIREFWLDFKAFCPEMAEKVFAAFADAGIDRSRLMIATFNYKALAYMQEHYPEVRRIAHIGIRRTKEQTFFCTLPPGKATFRSQQELLEALVAAKEEFGLFGVNMPISGDVTTEKDVSYLHSNGLWVSLWFVQNATQAAKCRGYGADAYVTDAVSAVRAGCREAVPAMADMPRLKIGIVSDIHLQHAYDPNDPKKQGMFSSQTFEHALAYFRGQGVDGVVVAGDLTEYGRLCELEASGIAWNRVFPDGKGLDGKSVAKLIIRGNHDKMSGPPSKDKPAATEPLIRDDPAGAFKKVFGIDDYAPIMKRMVGGYAFVLVNWDSEEEAGEWIRAHAAELPKDKPFFYVQHPHLKGTNIRNMDRGKATEALKLFSNAVAFSGHSHLSLTLGSQIWQGGFTSVGTSCLQWISQMGGCDNTRKKKNEPAGHTPAVGRVGRQGMLMSVYDDRIVLKRREFLTDSDVGPDWVIPLDGSKPYAWEAQKARSVAPAFATDASVTVVRKEGRNSKREKERQLQLEFPRPLPARGESGRTLEYEVVAFSPEDGEARPLLVRRVYAERYFLADELMAKTGLVCFAENELPKDAWLRFAVRAMTDWEKRSEPIYGEYRPEVNAK